jgi:hypothetical protein
MKRKFINGIFKYDFSPLKIYSNMCVCACILTSNGPGIRLAAAWIENLSLMLDDLNDDSHDIVLVAEVIFSFSAVQR